MQFDNKKAVYLQIYDMIISDIINSKYGAGDKIKSIRDLVDELAVNQNTILHAFRLLENDEIIYTKRGLGYFVTENEEKLISLRKNIISNLINNMINELKKLKLSKEEILRAISEVYDANN